MTKIALFVSGSGSLIQSFLDSGLDLSLVVADRECLGLEVARELKINNKLIKRFDAAFAKRLNDLGIKHICMAGFLKIVDKDFIDAFNGKILNTHPSLLPLHAGYYGDKVHQAVVESKESTSGFTVHEVVEEVDAGKIIEQIECDVMPNDSVESLRTRVQNLEKENYAKIAFNYLNGK